MELTTDRCLITLCVCSVALSGLPLSNPTECSLTGFSVHGIISAGIFEWIAISKLQGLFLTQGIKPASPSAPALAGGFFTTDSPGKPILTFIVHHMLDSAIYELYVISHFKTLWQMFHLIYQWRKRLTMWLSCPRSQRQLMASDRVLASVHHQSLGS